MENTDKSVKHTPGPWKVSAQVNGKRHVVREGCQAGESALCMLPEGRIESERMANARLIASAPELLAACLAFNDAYSFISENAPAPLMHAVRKARAAIARARGE